jgi:hypothetical protein
VSRTASVVPSTATASSPQTWDHGLAPAVSGERRARNSDRSGASPSRARPADSDVVAGASQPAAASRSPSPAVTCRITSRYGLAPNRHSPRVKYKVSRAGSDRSRISHASPSPTASSARSGGMAYVSAPSQPPDKIRPRADDQPHGMPP